MTNGPAEGILYVVRECQRAHTRLYSRLGAHTVRLFDAALSITTLSLPRRFLSLRETHSSVLIHTQRLYTHPFYIIVSTYREVFFLYQLHKMNLTSLLHKVRNPL